MFRIFSRFRTSALLLLLIFPVSALAYQSPLWEQFPLGLKAEAVRALPDAYDCTVLYSEQTVICVDQRQDFQIEDGILAVFLKERKVHSLELTAPLTQANYTKLLANLRRQGLVFAHLNVAGETLDVLAGMQSLDRQTLDDQMFVLANRSSYLTPREYLLVDNRDLAEALHHGYRNVQHWLQADSTSDSALERVHLVTLKVVPQQIVTRITYPFAG
ncbi:hypothetical protein [Photobacterium atrarenae]|uniref:Uncharacterized protein n=1 Tax=Photobacterium atrarenae TaxID=865757 RepID=A0ABY5GLU4_9GAMM|nr:hypothetical protein [Photobacterium atrarenae]UTV29710.1 hypothetical protein NNL38_22125 [Photobacterium atrarenae]